MADPLFEHPHTVDQVLHLVDDVVPPHIMDRLRPVLIDRDRAAEDGVNQGLRKSVSAGVLGNNGALNTVYPVWSRVRNFVIATIEKKNASSRFEVDASICGQAGVVDMTLVAGARWSLADGTSVANTDEWLGQAPIGAGQFYTYTVHGSIAQGAPVGTYNVVLLAAVGVAGQSWQQDGAGLSSLRVVESVY